MVLWGAESLTLVDADLVFKRLSGGMRIGEAMLAAKQIFAASNNPYQLDILVGWTVLEPPVLIINH